MSTEKQSIHDKITSQIITDLEQGKMIWEKPYNGGLLRLPSNPSTGKTYQGINTLVLWSTAQQKGYKSNQWLTFKQALDLGCAVKKGEKATPVVFYKSLTIEDKETSEEKSIPMLRQYCVFNLEQIEGAEKYLNIEHYQPNEIESLALGEKVLSLANIEHKLNNSPCFVPSHDLIRMPLKDQFKSQLDYYATALHELTHWTGHESRLDRLNKYSESRHFRAFEELVAELGAAFLCAELGLEYTTQHAAYIQSWLKALKDDNKMIFKAAAQAQKAINLIKEKAQLTNEQNETTGAA